MNNIKTIKTKCIQSIPCRQSDTHDRSTFKHSIPRPSIKILKNDNHDRSLKTIIFHIFTQPEPYNTIKNLILHIFVLIKRVTVNFQTSYFRFRVPPNLSLNSTMIV